MEPVRRTPGLVFWSTVACIALAIVYPLSEPPVALLLDSLGNPEPAVEIALFLYEPLDAALGVAPEWLFHLYLRYDALWS